MKFRESLTRKNTIIGASILIVGLIVAGFFVLRRPPRVAMERYVPAEALAYLEIDSLANLVDGLTSTKAWRELAPVLGLSSQLQQIGLIADLVGRSGFGPDEAVVAGRAQCAIAITGIESEAGKTDEGPYLHLRPRFALIIETHMSPESATRLVRDRSAMIAQRIYGESVLEHTDQYRDSQLRIFEGPGPDHQLVAASKGSAILIANRAEAMKQCLDAMAGGTATLADDATLKQMRLEVGRNPSVFGYVTASGIEKLVDLWPLLIAGSSAEPETVGTFGDLVEHLSKQTGAGLLYSCEFESDGVTEKYLTVLRPQVAEALAQPLKAGSATRFESLALTPHNIESLTLINVENAAELPERVFKQLSPAVDIVAGVALREFVINLKKQYGLAPADTVGDAVGGEMALINFGDEQPRALLIRVNDKSRLEPMVRNYVTRRAAALTNDQYNGTEILSSSDGDRHAAFVGNFLVLGTRDQIVRVIETNAKRDGEEGDERLGKALKARPANASIVHYRVRVEDAGKLILAISKLTRVTDGSPELLDRDSARKALEVLPRSISFTEFRDYGVYTETHSAVGSLSVVSGALTTGE
jgi:hypothetical protein